MNKFEALRHFCTAAETLNFREAANRLAVSPQVVTRMIAELENELGEMLFKRNTRNIKLTPFGEDFLPNAQLLLIKSEKLFTSNQSKKDKMKGIVRITVPPLLDHYSILKQLFMELDAYPDIKIDWRVNVHSADLIEEQIDIGLRIGAEPNSNFIIKPVGIIEEVIVASPILIKKIGIPKNIEELMQYPTSGLINLKTGKLWSWFIDTNLQLVPKQPCFITNDFQSELLACLSGKTFSLLPKETCMPYIKNNELNIVFPKLIMPKWQLYLYRPYQAITTARVLKVFNLLSKILQSKLNVRNG